MSVVVGYKDTPRGEAAFARGVEEARLRGCPLHLLWAVEVEAPRGHSSASARGQSDRLGSAETRLAEREAAARAAGVGEVASHLVLLSRGEGQFLHEVLHLVDRVAAELVVIGIRDRSPVGKLVLGSRAQDVLLHVDCDVLAVKAPAAS